MDILIKGIEMPKGNNVLVVDSAGTITKVNRWTGKAEATDPFHVKAIALPEHGRLGDLDRLKMKFDFYKVKGCWGIFSEEEIHKIKMIIDEEITIVEASNGTDN